MNLINDNFCNLVPNDFLTENASLFLYSLIKCARPKNIIEVGSGYSTIFISRAIKDIQKENLEIGILSEEKSKFTGHRYNPTFNVVEDFSHPKSVKNILDILKNHELDKNLNFINESVEKYLSNSRQKYDFVWMDFGSGKEYMRFFKIFLEKLNSGGYIIVHSTITNLAGRLFASELKLMSDNSLEIISIVEPHKQFQNSFTVVKKVMEYPLHSVFG